MTEEKEYEHCYKCNKELLGEIHCEEYDAKGLVPPLFCSEKCMWNRGLYFDIKWKIIRFLKKHIFKNWYYG